ncbi:MAG: hypothetical protein GF416_06005 [Candidatus Altiarchaeales archaeon]|nr:hypothetical protein [Candidatus Altiarchaeales archaeon]MBD3416669.1 hypothetical protein [Candidatus Altiarchaeales archaeon]
MKLLWCITGGEYHLEECVEYIEGLNDITLVFSQAGMEVTAMYGLMERIRNLGCEIVHEKDQGSSAPIIRRLRQYGKVVVAPCTANTAAKIANGIADSLVSNIVSQGLKMGLEIIVLPTDSAEEVKGKAVDGSEVSIRCRDIDLENVDKIRGEVLVVSEPGHLGEALG